MVGDNYPQMGPVRIGGEEISEEEYFHAGVFLVVAVSVIACLIAGVIITHASAPRAQVEVMK